ncbi:FKBP-type peptidyl-prolyl cis-trans isomerase [Rappaport israeli]|uniref:FKBP-type peptidyl-prolyl cis-trans isomerase n=1 Tax=Rappaport israeli TaxID=1839807 RepID=UPI0009300ACE|nr:peptidylprolyl isomerase [Rappaport israeli]
MQIQNNATVSIHYTLKNNDGEILDSSQGREPLVFVAGEQQILPALEQALMGKQKGEHIEVTLTPEEGYGVRHEEAVQEIPKSQLAEVPNLEVGMPLQAETPEGMVMVFVAAIGEETVIIDGNHPLAGQTLNFSVDIENVESNDESPKIIMPN